MHRKTVIQRRLGMEGLDKLAEFKAIRAYQPQRFPGDAVLVRATETLGASDPRAQDPRFGWGALIGGRITVCTIDGTHGGILTGLNVEPMGAALRAAAGSPPSPARSS
jgi:thioesterase domain-containing protein